MIQLHCPLCFNFNSIILFHSSRGLVQFKVGSLEVSCRAPIALVLVQPPLRRCPLVPAAVDFLTAGTATSCSFDCEQYVQSLVTSKSCILISSAWPIANAFELHNQLQRHILGNFQLPAAQRWASTIATSELSPRVGPGLPDTISCFCRRKKCQLINSLEISVFQMFPWPHQLR